ncbi:MAG: hypothetical protein AB7V32_02680 [Candidatus Berkiella sp.]
MITGNQQKQGTKREREEDTSDDTCSNNDAPSDALIDAVLLNNPIVHIFHHLGPTSFVGNNALYRVCKNWRQQLQQNGSWRKKVTVNGLVQTCSEEELLNLLASREAFRLFSFHTILELLSQHPQLCEAWQQEYNDLPLNEEEVDALSIQSTPLQNVSELYSQNHTGLARQILSNPTMHLPNTIAPEVLVTLASMNRHIAFYILEHDEKYQKQLSDDVLSEIGQSHPQVAATILETPRLASVLDGSHFTNLCYFGQAQLTEYILNTPRLLNICIEEDLLEMCRIKKLCQTLAEFAQNQLVLASEAQVSSKRNRLGC